MHGDYLSKKKTSTPMLEYYILSEPNTFYFQVACIQKKGERTTRYTSCPGTLNWGGGSLFYLKCHIGKKEEK